MSHSITVLEIAGSPRAVEILAGLASRLNVDSISPDNAGQAQLWLSFDAASAYAIAIAALDRTAGDWGEHITVVPPEHEARPAGTKSQGSTRATPREVPPGAQLSRGAG
jgi:hypothetical protein